MLYKVRDIERLLADDYMSFIFLAYHTFESANSETVIVKRESGEEVSDEIFEYDVDASIERLENIVKNLSDNSSNRALVERARCELFLAALKQLKVLRQTGEKILTNETLPLS